MKAFVLVVVLLTSSECLAQATATQTFEQLGKRLEEAQQALASPSSPGRTNRGQRNEARPNELYVKDAAANTAKIMGQIVQEFKDNPRVRVKGFKIMLGLSPRFDIDLEVPPFRQ